MVLDDVSQEERRGLLVAVIAVAFVSLTAGFAGGSLSSPTGDFSADSASTDEVEEVAQSLMDQQVSAQERRMALAAQQSENISQDDISISAEVDEVAESEFPSLYKVTVSITGDTVSMTGEVESIDEEQTMYISKDGRYVFQEPTDLQEVQQQQQQGNTTQQAPEAPEQ